MCFITFYTRDNCFHIFIASAGFSTILYFTCNTWDVCLQYRHFYEGMLIICQTSEMLLNFLMGCILLWGKWIRSTAFIWNNGTNRELETHLTIICHLRVSWHKSPFHITVPSMGNRSSVDYLHKRSVMWSSNVFFVLGLDNIFDRQPNCWLFEMPWCLFDVIVIWMPLYIIQIIFRKF